VKIRLCSAADVAAGAVIKVETMGLAVAVFNLNGEYYVTDDGCTHGPGSMSEGFVEGDCVECNFHQGVFNIKTGAVVQPPCMIPLKTYTASVEGGDVYIEHHSDAPGAIRS
jgi:biphenyl 2,3-dioxygenase ferredoxin subunit